MKNKTTAENLEKRFDQSDDVMDYFDLSKASRPLLVGSIVLLVLVVIQIVLGHQITDNKQDWLIGVHVPLAFIIFGIAVWLPINAVALRRASAKSP